MTPLPFGGRPAGLINQAVHCGLDDAQPDFAHPQYRNHLHLKVGQKCGPHSTSGHLPVNPFSSAICDKTYIAAQF
jgi:hypothetical protein